MSNLVRNISPYPYSQAPRTTLYIDKRDPDPIAALARAEAEGRELTPAQKELAWKLITAAFDTPEEE